MMGRFRVAEGGEIEMISFLYNGNKNPPKCDNNLSNNVCYTVTFKEIKTSLHMNRHPPKVSNVSLTYYNHF